MRSVAWEWVKKLKTFVEETTAGFGDIPAAAIEFGASDPDAEIDRIITYLGEILPGLKREF